MSTVNIKQSRFELRLSVEDREFFEAAAKLSGYKTLANFLTSTARERAEKIIEEKQKILASKQDKEIFFEAIVSGGKPNAKLKSAAKTFLDKKG